MRDVFFFDAMLTPKIITFVYWLLLVSAVVAGLGAIVAGHGGVTVSKLAQGVAIMVGGGLGARISCELLIVLFKIHENIRRLADTRA